jgi:lysophospholipase L1-like esterase
MANPASTGAPATDKPLVIGLGDSWFHYFAIDVFDVLNEDHGVEALSLAREGTQLRQMVEDPAQLLGLSSLLAQAWSRGRTPRAILLSAGGNDVVTPQLKDLLLDAAPGGPVLDDPMVAEWVDLNLREALIGVLDAITRLCRRQFGSPVPILLHSYAYPNPDGRGLIETWKVWLKPDFIDRRYAYPLPQQPPPECTQAMATLIDRFFAVQQSVAGLPEFAQHVRVVDLRKALDTFDRLSAWGNELHPTPDGFREVAKRIAHALP